MTATADRVEELGREAREALAAAGDEDALEAWRTGTLGRSGTLTGILRGLGDLDPDARREVGRYEDVVDAPWVIAPVGQGHALARRVTRKPPGVIPGRRITTRWSNDHGVLGIVGHEI